MSFIRFQNVTREYNVGSNVIKALNNVNLEIRQGDFTVILGPSGSGKSTFLNLLGGMDYVTRGEIYVGENNISKFTNKERTLYRRKDIGFVFQFYNLIPTLTAYENVDMVSKLSDVSISADEALEMVGLKDRAENLPSRLSGGELQRVSIARALCKNPKLLLCDEPKEVLQQIKEMNLFEQEEQPLLGKKVLITLSSMAKDYGHTVVLVTHNAAVAPAADRLIRLRDGEVSEIMDQKNPISMEEVFW